MSDRIGVWPELAVSQWADTRDTLQLMTQVVGKVRMVNTALMSHWWNVVLYVSARGLTTGLIPHGDRGFQVDFDFIEHQLVVATTVGQRRSVPLRAGPIAQFYREVMATLDELGLSTRIWPMPVEIADAIAFDHDTLHVAYDEAAAHRFWLALVQINRVFEIFRSRYIGKVSPVHFFWGAADLAVTRFSGRPAPKHPGGAPNCGPHVMWARACLPGLSARRPCRLVRSTSAISPPVSAANAVGGLDLCNPRADRPLPHTTLR